MVYLFLKDGFEEAEALFPVDILRRADVELRIAGDGAVTGGHGVAVQPDCPIADVVLTPDTEMLILPGGGAGVDNLWADERVRTLVTQAAARGIRLAAICAAPTILGRLGLLEGKLAVCYPGREGEMGGADTSSGAEVVTDGLITTAKAAGASAAFGLELARVLRGGETAERVRRAMYITDTLPTIRV